MTSRDHARRAQCPFAPIQPIAQNTVRAVTAGSQRRVVEVIEDTVSSFTRAPEVSCVWVNARGAAVDQMASPRHPFRDERLVEGHPIRTRFLPTGSAAAKPRVRAVGGIQTRCIIIEALTATCRIAVLLSSKAVRVAAAPPIRERDANPGVVIKGILNRVSLAGSRVLREHALRCAGRAPARSRSARCRRTPGGGRTASREPTASAELTRLQRVQLGARAAGAHTEQRDTQADEPRLHTQSPRPRRARTRATAVHRKRTPHDGRILEAATSSHGC